MIKRALAVAALMAAAPAAHAAGAFDHWLNPEGARCVPVADIGAVAKVVTLEPGQFEFLRGLYIAMPPLSHDLPSGDHAIIASNGEETMAALVDGDQTCARFLLPNWLLDMVFAVGRGDVQHRGDPL